jgi:hypothetical protein
MERTIEWDRNRHGRRAMSQPYSHRAVHRFAARLASDGVCAAERWPISVERCRQRGSRRADRATTS